jgi:PAT family beta-lactamase induction signal transducer AmpG
MQIVLALFMGALGFITPETHILILTSNVFILTLAGAVHDIVGDHVRLKMFTGKNLGIATSIGTIGFRIGMLLSGAGTLYAANFFGWPCAFMLTSSTIVISFLATIFLPKQKAINDTDIKLSLKNYYRSGKSLIKKHGVAVILLLTLSFKFSDSCISSLKPIFLHSKNIDKISFANISQLLGSVAVIGGGFIAGLILAKCTLNKCLRISFLSQIIAASCFIILSIIDFSLPICALCVNTSSFILGFSAVIYRTYISNISMMDVNNYTLLISIGSAGRIISSYLGGIISDRLTWTFLFALCLLSNLPGLFVCRKLSAENYLFSGNGGKNK